MLETTNYKEGKNRILWKVTKKHDKMKLWETRLNRKH